MFIGKWNKFLLKEFDKPSKESATRLVVFDFDGTLFRSPNPPDDFKGNWWASKESLAEPHVPKEPDRSYWFKDTVTATEEAFNDSKTFSVMLTGRMEKNFQDRIMELLDQNGIQFHEIGMNDSGQDTVDFKLKEIKKILKQYPKISSIEIWDDKKDHLNKFKSELETGQTKVKIHKVANVIDESRMRAIYKL
jgi:hypothetical protein